MTTTAPSTALADLTDYSTLTKGPDGNVAFDMTNRVIRGTEAAAEQVLRSWCTDRGELHWAPGQGENVTRLENATANSSLALSRWRSRLVGQAKRANGFVRSCAVAITYDASTRTVLIAADLTFTDRSTASLDVAISMASGAILKAEVRVTS